MAATSGSSIAGAGDAERAKAAAAELVRSAPDVFVVATAPALAELHRLTSTIPIVFTQVGDPLEAGSIASLARTGDRQHTAGRLCSHISRNVTGERDG